MATKTIELAGVGQVVLIKRAGSRNLRLSVTPTGVRISMPHWTPYKAAHAFALQNLEWILQEVAKQTQPLIESGQKIGKMHYVRFEHTASGQSIASRVTATEVVVRMQQGEVTTDQQVQKRARQASLRALKREAERLLPPRLKSLAEKHGRVYSSVGVKQLKRRWGSCDSYQAIVLNLFLMELPWEHIDYVLMHELTHTTEMNHGPGFWRALTAMEPRARVLSKQLRTHQPSIGTWEN